MAFDAKEVRELLDYAEEADRHNREEGETDLRFEAFDDWNEQVRNLREGKGLPCISINMAQQYTSLVVGDWLLNESSIQVLPREGGDTDVANVRQELIRSIELQSNATQVYSSSFGKMLSCGVSNFRVAIEDANDNPFLRDIFIRSIPAPFAVRWDPLSYDPTGRDAGFCFVTDEMKKTDYVNKYPKAALPSTIQRDAGTKWSDGKIVYPQEYWSIVEKTRTIGMTEDGEVVDLTDIPQKKWPKLSIDIETKKPVVADDAKCKYAVMVVTNGLEQLTDPLELKLPRLPIVRVSGKEVVTPDHRVRFGIVRCIRDQQLMRNYLRSLRMELLLKAPRANFFGPASAIEGREGDFPEYLAFNDSTTPPQQITTQNFQALLNEDNMFAQDMMLTTGLHEASQGMPSNESSGIAIQRRQSEGDTATAIYHHNMNMAQVAAGEVINALIPTVYDTTRTVRTVGPDLSAKMVRINDPHSALMPDGSLDLKHYATGKYHPDKGGNPQENPAYIKDSKKYQNVKQSIPDMAVGQYDVTLTTGPSFATRRQEGVAQLMDLASKAPQIAQAAPDIIVSEMDLVNGQQLAERLKRTVPPQILGNDAEDGKDPQQIAQDQQQAQQAQQMQQMGVQLEMEGKQAETQLKQAQARKAMADAEKSEAEAMKAKIEAAQAMNGSPDPSVEAEQTRTAILGYDAITRRLEIIEKGNMPGTPPALEQHLAPIIANAVGQALAKHLNFQPAELGLPQPIPMDQGDPAQPANTQQPDMGAAA